MDNELIVVQLVFPDGDAKIALPDIPGDSEKIVYGGQEYRISQKIRDLDNGELTIELEPWEGS